MAVASNPANDTRMGEINELMIYRWNGGQYACGQHPFRISAAKCECRNGER